MFEFMDYIQQAFSSTTGWNPDNSYSNLTATAQAFLEFHPPTGLKLQISSLPTPNYAQSYSLNAAGVVDGSLSFLYTSLPLRIPSASVQIPLRSVVRGYRQLDDPVKPDETWWWEVWHRGRRIDSKDQLLFGRIFAPGGSLEAMYIKRQSPTTLLTVKAVSDSSLTNGGTVLAVLARDFGRFSTEYLYSTDSALLGARGLYNFGADPRHAPFARPASSDSAAFPSPRTSPGKANDNAFPVAIENSPPSLLSLGGEVYYGLLSKSFGLSTGARFTTLPSHNGFPYTMALTLNPLMGNLSSTYSVKAGRSMAFSTKFDFNFYSYESGVSVGCEIWRQTKSMLVSNEAPTALIYMHSKDKNPTGSIQSQMSKETRNRLDQHHESHDVPVRTLLHDDCTKSHSLLDTDANTAGVFKARVDQDWRIKLLWEGRFKELLYSVGTSLDLKRRDQFFKGIGLEISYSS